MSAVTEMPTQQEIDSFQAPTVLFGRLVAFFPNAIRNSRKPSLGWVTASNGRITNIFEVTQHGGTLLREGVRHIDDPKLKLNEDQRASGAWDFTEDDKTRAEEDAEFHKRLMALEQSLLAEKGRNDRNFLMGWAKRLELKNYSTQKNEEVLLRIMEATNPQEPVE